MKLAVKEATKGITNLHGGPFGAIIVRDDIVVGRGHNTVVKDHDCTCHGEMNAIRNACKKLGTFDLTGCEIYTTGEPCPMCLGAILWSNIGKVYYGCNIQDTAEIGFRDEVFYEFAQKDKSTFIVELDREQVLKLYAQYQSITDKTNY
jgi:guanine deaminase